MLWSGLLLGFLMGMRHAMDADHLAAVASLATTSRNTRQTLSLGLVWGLGHTTSLFFFGLAILLLDVLIPESVASWLEFAVGVMLVLLGLDVTRRMWQHRIHFHLHDHGDGERHFHAHGHAHQNREQTQTSPQPHHQTTHHRQVEHQHDHPTGLPWRALVVGMVHGLAGSAPLILLTVQTAETPVWGLVYILLFGLGSLVGMGALTLAISYPLRMASQHLTTLYNTICLIIGVVTIGLGGIIMAQHI